MGAQAQTNKQATEPVKKGVQVSGQVKVQANLTFSPVLHIELGSGPKPGEVGLNLKTVDDYRKGADEKKLKQLKVFSIGSGYTVKAGLSAGDKEKTDALYKIFRLGLALANAPKVDQKNPASNVDLFTGNPEGTKELDAEYWVLPANAQDKIQAINTLLGKDGNSQTHTINITYTIAPN